VSDLSLYPLFWGVFSGKTIFSQVVELIHPQQFRRCVVRYRGDYKVKLIGKAWVSSSDQEGKRRIDNPDDFVRLEIATALKRDIRVIPVLVNGALMPQSRDLPDDLKVLPDRNALQLSHDRFHADSEQLVSAIERALRENRGGTS
jgi:hypothetical protein